MRDEDLTEMQKTEVNLSKGYREHTAKTNPSPPVRKIKANSQMT